MKLTSLIRLTILIAVGVFGSCNKFQEKNAGPPNVLMISIDDLNNWIEPMGGHQQAITPQLSYLLKKRLCFLIRTVHLLRVTHHALPL